MLGIVAAVLFLLNWTCWQPGVGGAVGGKPPGTQLERFFGWPATYQAELWRSDDQELASRILASAPFYDPNGEMSLEYRVLGVGPLAINIAFALLALFSVTIITEGTLRRAWGGWQAALLGAAGILLIGLWAISPSVSVSL
jgi:hypothetical protein